VNNTAKSTLLFVDDEERILRTLDMAFRHHYRILTTTDGREALRILRDEAIDVVISDQRMPHMTGVELLRGARHISPATMRILLTGYAELASIVGSINDGEIFRYVQKPWLLQELRSTISEAVEIARSTRSLNTPEPTGLPEQGIIVVLHSKQSMAQFLIKEKPSLQVHYANNVEQALLLLSQYPKAMLLTDLILPEGDISDALAMLKLRRPELVVIVVTAFSDTSHLIRLINRAQVYRVLPMPLSRKMLLGSLDSALRHQQVLNNSPQMLRRHKVEPTNMATLPNTAILMRVRSYLDRLRA
jgi:serine/threonine-protein kinase